MHTHWSWLPTILTILALLAPFLLAGVALVRRHSPRRIRRTPHSISTPYGQIGYEDIRTQKMLAQGIERARRRSYVNPRDER